MDAFRLVSLTSQIETASETPCFAEVCQLTHRLIAEANPIQKELICELSLITDYTDLEYYEAAVTKAAEWLEIEDIEYIAYCVSAAHQAGFEWEPSTYRQVFQEAEDFRASN